MRIFYLIIAIPLLLLHENTTFHENVGCLNNADSTGDTLKWSAGYKLTYDDFKAKEPDETLAKRATGTWHLGGTACTGFLFDLKAEGKNTTVDASAYFVKSRSWLLKPDGQVLKHEQGHFDISEIYARKFKQAMKGISDKGDISYWNKLLEKYNEIREELLKEQDNYDDMTLTAVGREYYYKKIQDELKSGN